MVRWKVRPMQRYGGSRKELQKLSWTELEMKY